MRMLKSIQPKINEEGNVALKQPNASLKEFNKKISRNSCGIRKLFDPILGDRCLYLQKRMGGET